MLAFLQVSLALTGTFMQTRSAEEEAKDPMTTRGHLALAGYRELKEEVLPKGDIEVRMWSGFGIAYPDCLILRFHEGAWTAMYLPSKGPEWPKSKRTQKLGPPVGGWPSFWRKAGRLGIWWLPDDSALDQKRVKAGLDGTSYLIEYRLGSGYRAYGFWEPQIQTQWPEAKRMFDLFVLEGRAFLTVRH